MVYKPYFTTFLFRYYVVYKPDNSITNSTIKIRPLWFIKHNHLIFNAKFWTLEVCKYGYGFDRPKNCIFVISEWWGIIWYKIYSIWRGVRLNYTKIFINFFTNWFIYLLLDLIHLLFRLMWRTKNINMGWRDQD